MALRERDELQINVDRLRGGAVIPIDGTYSPELLEVDSDDALEAREEIHVEGEAYVAGKELYVRYSARTHVHVPCAVCNSWATVELSVNEAVRAVPVDEVTAGVCRVDEWIREDLLLDLPLRAECEGMCPQRGELHPFLKRESEDDGYRPFSDLDV